jgi:ABC-type amino acid transport substrate-binding protein
MLAGELGVRARFQQGQWDRLPLLLDRTADCVINGIELLPERRRDYGCSRPYFGYALQMVGRRGSPPGTLADLTAALRDAGVSIESLIQPAPAAPEATALIVMVTHDLALAATLGSVRVLHRGRLETQP